LSASEWRVLHEALLLFLHETLCVSEQVADKVNRLLLLLPITDVRIRRHLPTSVIPSRECARFAFIVRFHCVEVVN